MWTLRRQYRKQSKREVFRDKIVVENNLREVKQRRTTVFIEGERAL